MLELNDPSDMFFLQIGAFDGVSNDPIHHHVVKHGWRGVLIEPQPWAYERLKETYKDCSGLVIRNVAISDQGSKRELFVLDTENPKAPHWAGQVASFDRATITKHAALVPEANEIQSIVVDVMPLKAVISEHQVERIDVLQIDTEGFDFEILKMVDFEALAPFVIHYEHCHLNKADAEKSFRLLIENGYQVAVGETDTIARLTIPT